MSAEIAINDSGQCRKLLVTGATGYVGGRLWRLLEARGERALRAAA